MDGAELTAIGLGRLRLIVCLLYVVVCAFSYRRLIPRLPLQYKGVAGFFLLAQILVTVAALEFQSTEEWAGWLWDLDEEHNIASALASTQLAMVGWLAALGGWLARARPRWQRLYLIALGLVFLYFAAEEFNNLRGGLESWALHYTILGAVAGLAILAAAFRAPPRERIWHICLLTGLAMAAAGAILLEALRDWKTCQAFGLYFLDRCRLYVFEESLEFLGIWLTLIAMLSLFAAAVPRPTPRTRRAIYALPVLSMLIIPQWIVWLNLEAPLTAQPASAVFESEVNWRDVRLNGYRIDQREESLALLLYAKARGSARRDLGFSVNLVDQATGQSYASVNRGWERDAGPAFGPGNLRIYRQSATVDIPAATPSNRALWIALTLWREEDGNYVFDAARSSDLQVLGDSQLVLGEMVIPSVSPPGDLSASAAVFDQGLRLEAIDLPERAKAGESLSLTFRWRADADLDEDYIQFLHIGQVESGEWLVHDQQPLGARLPARLWYSGLADRETWLVPLPAELEPGQYAVFTGLYRRSDGERLPASDDRGKPYVDARAPLGRVTIEKQENAG